MLELQPFKKYPSKDKKNDDIGEPENFDERHTAMLQAMLPYTKSQVQGNVSDVVIRKATRKTKLILIIMPSWAVMFPPFNLARLSAVAIEAGYQTQCIDMNIKSYKYCRALITQKNLKFDPWEFTKDWKWLGKTYSTELHPFLEPLYIQWIDNIVRSNPTVIGFTMYHSNEQSVLWMAREIKKILPETKILLGGPHVQVLHNNVDMVFDYIVVGEGEQILLEILEEIENGIINTTQERRTQPEDQRLNLNNLPMPDYKDFDFNDYVMPNGINTELSRGCTAKCTFCEETHYWRYRQRLAIDTLNEIEWLYHHKGSDVIWFIDSLVNGNLRELRAFCKGVIAKKLKIHWTGYGRSDGRMDEEYFRDLADSGCVMISYGMESGSQHVLDDMSKGVTLAEMEQNLIDGKKVGILAHTMWMVGFPTEKHHDFADTMTFIWRNRNNNISRITTGYGFGLGTTTIVSQNLEKFGLSDHYYCDSWITKDFTLSKFHVLYRVKAFAIFLQQRVTTNFITVARRPELQKHHYSIKYLDPRKINEIEYEKFNYNIINSGISAFADSLMNEIFVLFRTLWRIRGGFEMEIIFDPTLDIAEFGYRQTGKYWAKHVFIIDNDGNWSANFQFKFDQAGSSNGEAFKCRDYSRVISDAAKRARVHGKSKWIEAGRTDQELENLRVEAATLNNAIDLSFEYVWKSTGHWQTSTTDQKARVIPIQLAED